MRWRLAFRLVVGLSLVARAVADDDPTSIIENLLKAQSPPVKAAPDKSPSPATKTPAPRKPAPKPIDPKAQSIIDEIADRPVPPAPPAPAVDAGSREILNDLTGDPTIQAAELLAKARKTAQAGNWSEAAKLARAAKRLDPAAAAIQDFLHEAEPRASKERQATAGAGRAKAHIAAALTRGQELASDGKLDEARDVLLGVVNACSLFGSDRSVDLYRKAAERALAQLAPPATEEPVIESGDDEGIAPIGDRPPINADRLTRRHPVSPAWYALKKERLATPMNVDYPGAPLEKVVDDIRKRTGVPISFDETLRRDRLSPTGLVNLRVGGLPAETLLAIACEKSRLEYVLTERAVIITTPARAAEAARQLPEEIRRNWLSSRTLFPERVSAAAPASNRGARPSPRDPSGPAPGGAALVEEVRSLLPP